MRPIRLLVAAYLILGVEAGFVRNSTANRLLRGVSNTTNAMRSEGDDEPSLYRITVVGTFNEGENGAIITSSENEQISCIPIMNGKETDGLFAIELPETFVSENKSKILDGTLFLSITRAVLHGEEVLVGNGSIISVIPDPRDKNREATSSTIGTKTMAIVRISTRDATPKDDADTLRIGLFSPDMVNLKTQYSNCSFGQLEWVLAPVGVVEVFVDQPVSDFSSGAALVAAAQDTMKAKMGITNAADLGDKVLMCLPPGTGSWVASSGVNHWRAQFNNDWCLSLTATMHETGHMLGLTHSNENGIAYGDSTGYMAAGRKAVDWPRKCFNGLENWQLKWYQNRQVTLDDSFESGHLINLASFVDFNKTASDEPVIVYLADEFYLQYNTAKDFNVDTEEKKDEVTITSAGKGGSDGLAGLKENERYIVPNFRNTTRALVVHACRKRKGSLGADVMLISIGLDTSLCGGVSATDVAHTFALEQVTPLRTGLPTVAPTVAPTISPTSAPSAAPTNAPSSAPSSVPSKSPTASPTLDPSPSPTKIPTAIPTISLAPSKGSVFVTEPPSNGSVFLTETPSKQPSIAPSSPQTPSVGRFGFWNLFLKIGDSENQPTPAPKIDYEKLLKNREDNMTHKHGSQSVQNVYFALPDDYAKSYGPSPVKPVFEEASP